jgi:hypothetical protein
MTVSARPYPANARKKAPANAGAFPFATMKDQ